MNIYKSVFGICTWVFKYKYYLLLEEYFYLWNILDKYLQKLVLSIWYFKYFCSVLYAALSTGMAELGGFLDQQDFNEYVSRKIVNMDYKKE